MRVSALDFNIDELLAARNCVVVSWEGYMRVVTSIDGQMFRNDSELHQRLRTAYSDECEDVVGPLRALHAARNRAESSRWFWYLL